MDADKLENLSPQVIARPGPVLPALTRPGSPASPCLLVSQSPCLPVSSSPCLLVCRPGVLKNRHLQTTSLQQLSLNCTLVHIIILPVGLRCSQLRVRRSSPCHRGVRA